jgi:hypothetical protein
MMDERFKRWLEIGIPALDGLTPRQAAEKPPMRPRLASLLKGMIRQSENKKKDAEKGEDLSWVVKELGMEDSL